ncbi:MAG: hypothetical protein DYG89_28995 [Caldilinea sp. CFX5]|nr:hypothetical protein [Caldilinea sp. CFX5]
MILIPREELRATIDNWVSNQSFSRPVEVVTELQPGESADIVILTKDYWTAIPDTQKEFDTSKIVSNDFFTIIVPDSELSNDAKSLIDVLPAITIPPLSEGEAPPIDLNRDTGCWRQEGECCTLYLCDACAKICPALAEPITEETPVRIVVPGEENRLIVEAWMAQQSITGAIIVSELQPGEYADISIFTNESWLSIPDEQKSGDNTINLSDNDFTIVAPDTKHNELATNLLQVLPQLTVPDDTN